MINIGEVLLDLWNSSGFAAMTAGFGDGGWQNLVMLIIGCVLLYLGIVKQFEPLLMCGIAFGCVLTNLPMGGLYHQELWTAFMDPNSPMYHSFGAIMREGGLLDITYIGVKTSLYPCLIFMGVGAMTDFGPLLSNPKSLLLGAAAQLGVFIAFFGGVILGFTGPEAASIGIIGGADGPTAIFLTTKLAPHLLGAIAVAAYSYMALIPLIQPPIMNLMTTPEQRKIKMVQTRVVSKAEKIIFPILVTIFVALLLPDTAALIGCLMFGNLAKETGVTDRLSDTMQNALMNIVTILLSTSVGATMVGSNFLTAQTLKIVVLGVVAFGLSTAGG
ncbi:MAG: sodium ion-translocating decarboxylase subunit beta, partial [Oscillospiraceae bacterium]|nr:sodium ion-translocating decarboxylase subunit beta [Oscillospiraceae bacterium]